MPAPLPSFLSEVPDILNSLQFLGLSVVSHDPSLLYVPRSSQTSLYPLHLLDLQNSLHVALI